MIFVLRSRLCISIAAALVGIVGAQLQGKAQETFSAGVASELSRMLREPSLTVAGEPDSVPGEPNPQRQRKLIVAARSEKDALNLLEETKSQVSSAGVLYGKILHMETQRPLALLAYLRNDPRVQFVEEWSEIGRAPIHSPPTEPFNLNAQLTHNVPKLRKRYGIDGSGVTIGIWDEGPVLSNHVEFAGRLDVRDQGSPSGHATHVAGTIAAQGLERTAQGMAPAVRIVSYDWNGDLKELASAISVPSAIRVSNHSYGQLRGWSYSNSYGSWIWYGNPSISQTEDYQFGRYVTLSSAIDELVFNNPELAVFVAAGNERSKANDPNAVADWDGGHIVANSGNYVKKRRPANFQHHGYDTLEGFGVAKNVVAVGAIEDVPLGVDGVPPDAVRVAAFSSFGPTDDGRIKPDVVANGALLYSPAVQRIPGTSNYNPRAYLFKSGTSMATPAAAGIGALLTELSLRKRGKALRADEMRAVMIHTAVSPHNGPSYQTGWGALDALAAGELVAGDTGVLLNGLVKPAGAGKLQAKLSGGPVRITLTWIDAPGQPHSGGLNDRRRTLVTDLDLIAIDPSNRRYYPWSLDPDEPAKLATRDRRNDRDNVERIDIDAATGLGVWTIDVIGPETTHGHKFTLAISGLELVQ